MSANQLINLGLTRNEWYAIINALTHTSATYGMEHGGVSLIGLSDRIRDDVLVAVIANEKDKAAIA